MLKHPMTSRSHPNDIVAHICDSALHDKIEPHDSITTPSSSQSISPMPSTSSSAATLQDEQQDIEADDYDYRSQNTSVLTSTECAATVIHNQQIALDTRLAIFTDNDTSEPRVVHVSDDNMFLSHQIQLLSHSGNVHVVAAGDADDEVTAALHAAVSTATKQTVVVVLGVSIRQHRLSV